MLIFVDESGDTGFKLGGGSSGEFTISLVVFPDHAEAEAASRGIDKLRSEMRLSQGKEAQSKYEFHFNENSNAQRKAFLQAVSGFQFLIFSVTVNKSALISEGIGSKSRFYHLVCGLVFESARNYLSEANITLDSTGDQTFKKQLSVFLKQKMNEPGVGGQRTKKVGMKPSHSDNLLQLADMICGAIARACHQDKRQTDSFRK